MTEEIKMYRCTDESIWNAREDAEAHEQELQWEELVDKWLEARDFKKNTATRSKNAVMDYLKWRRGVND